MHQLLLSSRVVNTLTADYECSRHNRENLPLPIQMQLSIMIGQLSIINYDWSLEFRPRLPDLIDNFKCPLSLLDRCNCRVMLIDSFNCLVTLLNSYNCRVRFFDSYNCRVRFFDSYNCRVELFDNYGCLVSLLDSYNCRVGLQLYLSTKATQLL